MKQFLFSYLYTLTIRNKLLLFFGFIMICVGFISIYSQYTNFKLIDYSSKNLRSYYTINQLKMHMYEDEVIVQRYLRDMSEQNYQEIVNSRATINQMIRLIDRDIASLDTYLLFRAFSNAFISYQEQSQTTIELDQSDKEYYPSFVKLQRTNHYMGGYIDQLLNVSLSEGDWYFNRLSQQSQVMKVALLIGLVSIILLIVTFGFMFTNYLTRPIRKLVQATTQMSIGNWNIDEVEVKSRDEVGILTHSFNKMYASIRVHVEDLERKSLVESKLHEEELKNVRMQKLLNDAKFMGLQAQINPHFLFNTLNIIARTSMFEKAGKTTKLIQSLSHIFRYNLQESSKPISLKKELDIIREYIHIQHHRFSDRIQIELRCDDSRLDMDTVIIPSFTIQPLVENGIIHGLEPQEQGGRMRISVVPRGNYVHIKITDNGVGISPERMTELLEHGRSELTGDTTGIGIANVMSRLKIFYNCDCFFVKSKVGLGTSITIIVPTAKDVAKLE